MVVVSCPFVETIRPIKDPYRGYSTDKEPIKGWILSTRFWESYGSFKQASKVPYIIPALGRLNQFSCPLVWSPLSLLG